MSHKYYDAEFKNIQDYLSLTLSSEPTQVNRRENRELLATLYIRYIIICNKLNVCLDQMVQPQKRILLRKLLEATLGRILELKADLVEADLTEWTHCGDILEKLRITSFDAELQIPSNFRNDMAEEIGYKKKTIEEVLNKLGFSEKIAKKVHMSEQKAILVIQTHERARQGRLRAQFMKEIRNIKEKSKPTAATGENLNDEKKLERISATAAMKIQKIWRGYIARRNTRKRKIQEMILIGMLPAPLKRNNKEILKDRENEERRRNLQKEYSLEYKRDINNIEKKLEKNKKGPILEQLSDQLHEWLHEYKAQTGKIPEYASPERSPSRMLMLSRQGTESETSKSTPESALKDSKTKKEKIPKSPKENNHKSAEIEDEENRTKAISSLFVPELNVRREEYDEIWRNRDESLNPRQYHYKEIIEHDGMLKLENELRKIVDEMMKSELLLLQEAFDKDRGHKSKKKSSKKARKASKKGKKKKEKDLTPDRTTESLFEELVANGIIKKYPEVWMKDFIGEKSCNFPVPFNKGKEPKFDIGDLRQVLTEYCVIPLLTNHLHQTTPHIKSLLIAGPKGSGKDMLVHAISNETGAVLFDLTPSNIVGKYPGKSGLIMLLHLVVKVSKLLQPSIIYMDNAERPFVKKIPKTDRTDPKRLKKDLPKMIKNFSAEDRVLFIGVSDSPWESDQKLLQQVYQKFLIISKPNYGSRYLVWKHFLSKYLSIPNKFDVSTISKISDGYTLGSIVSTIKEVITVKRMLQLKIRPLSPLELVNVLCKKNPIYKEEQEALEMWWIKVPIMRRRNRAIELLQEEEAEVVAKQTSSNKK